MISCFWEGQEGSFLLWTFWHGVLGSIVYFSTKRGWRDIVMAVIASVNLILASMILGVFVPKGMGVAFFALAALVPMGYLAWRLFKNKDSLRLKGSLHVAALVLGLSVIYLALSGKAGLVGAGNASLGYKAYFVFVILFAIAGVAFTVYRLVKRDSEWHVSTKELLSIYALAAMGIVVAYSDFGVWKIGSSPFILMSSAFKNAPIFASNPDFIPVNGKGLNSLLQNYWMVIHPPTLFLGFASTAIPFAFVIGGLIRGKATEWIRPASSWMIFSVAILGVGIIMGGYWAYETLNFGGYWNWDPVENSSFVPWLVGIASLHGVVAYRKSKAFLSFSMVMVVSVFLMVLYSTFLTRSGILGETSVHTFTDLGLSGQLLVLLFVYLFGIIALFTSRTGGIPVAKKSVQTNSAEFFIFLGVLTLIFASLVITVFTSIPVFNKVLGTVWATPIDAPFFYYRWTVFFAIALAILSGLGQFLFWKKLMKVKASKAMMRPYMFAIVAAIIIMITIAIGTKWNFTLDDSFAQWKELADNSESTGAAMGRYIKWATFVFADEILLFAGLFMTFANLDILITLLRKNKRTRRVTGGSIAHVGFGLMLLGIFFSSGYDLIISQNTNPNELAALPQDSRNDNILLQKGRARNILGYQVTYVGKKEAVAPVSDLTIIQNDEASFKVRFRDATNDVFAFVMPKDVFLDENKEINLPAVEEFLNDKIEFLKPKHINERTLFGVKFVPRERDPITKKDILSPESAFTLYPEAEVNPQMGLLSHPSRKIFLDRDIYVHVSTIPKDEEEAKFKFYQFEVAMGDTVQTGRAKIYFDRITSDEPEGTEYELIAKAHLKLLTDLGTTVDAVPIYRIDNQNRVSIKDAYLDELYTSVAFVGVNPKTGTISLQVQERVNPPDDIVVIQAIQKPWINFLWLGTFVLTFGFGMAMYRRIKENRSGLSLRPDEDNSEADE